MLLRDTYSTNYCSGIIVKYCGGLNPTVQVLGGYSPPSPPVPPPLHMASLEDSGYCSSILIACLMPSWIQICTWSWPHKLQERWF